VFKEQLTLSQTHLYNKPASFKLDRKYIYFFSYFTTITTQVIQLILIMLVGTDVCVRMVFVWEETGVPE